MRKLLSGSNAAEEEEGSGLVTAERSGSGATHSAHFLCLWVNLTFGLFSQL